MLNRKRKTQNSNNNRMSKKIICNNLCYVYLARIGKKIRNFFSFGIAQDEDTPYSKLIKGKLLYCHFFEIRF